MDPSNKEVTQEQYIGVPSRQEMKDLYMTINHTKVPLHNRENTGKHTKTWKNSALIHKKHGALG